VDTGCDQLHATVDDQIATIVFDNPDKHNAMTGDMLAAFSRACAALAADPSVKVVVVRGAGERAFISGADLGQLGAGGLAGAPAERDPNRSGDRLTALGKPVIAMIHGWCLGGGVAIALSSDLRLCADDAQFGIPAARLGVGYPHEATATLVALVGPGQASEILFSGRRLDAAEAARIGLVNRVVAKADLEAETYALAREIADNAPLSHVAHRRSIHAAVTGATAELDGVAEAIASAWASDDFLEGGRAFAEKRPPRFEGR